MLQKQCLLHNFSELRNSHVVVIPVEIISDHLSKGKLRGDDSKLQLIEVLKHQNEYVKTSLVRFQTTSTDEPLEQFTYWYSGFSITELLTWWWIFFSKPSYSPKKHYEAELIVMEAITPDTTSWSLIAMNYYYFHYKLAIFFWESSNPSWNLDLKATCRYSKAARMQMCKKLI